jgi:hypothetical protein
MATKRTCRESSLKGPVGTATILVGCTLCLWPLAIFLTLFADDPALNNPWGHRLLAHIWGYPAYVVVAIALGRFLRSKLEFRGGPFVVWVPVLAFLVVSIVLGGLSSRYIATDGLSSAERRFFSACRAGDVVDVESHLARGADPNRRSHRGRTPLLLAYEADDEEVVRLLLRHGADPNVLSHHVERLLGEPRLLEFLLEHGLDPSRAYLHEAVRRGHVEAVRVLLEHGSSASSEQSHALILAVDLERWEAASMLVEQADEDGLTEAISRLREPPPLVEDGRRDALIAAVEERLTALGRPSSEADARELAHVENTVDALQANATRIYRVEILDRSTREVRGNLDSHSIEQLRGALLRDRPRPSHTTTSPPWDIILHLYVRGRPPFVAHFLGSRLRLRPGAPEDPRVSTGDMDSDLKAAEIESGPSLFDVLEDMLGEPREEYDPSPYELRQLR